MTVGQGISECWAVGCSRSISWSGFHGATGALEDGAGKRWKKLDMGPLRALRVGTAHKHA